jgi:hypothetical protein
MIYSHSFLRHKKGEKGHLRFAVITAIVLGYREHKRQAAELQKVAVLEECSSFPSGDHWTSTFALADWLSNSCHSVKKNNQKLKYFAEISMTYETSFSLFSTPSRIFFLASSMFLIFDWIATRLSLSGLVGVSGTSLGCSVKSQPYS